MKHGLLKVGTSKSRDISINTSLATAAALTTVDTVVDGIQTRIDELIKRLSN